MHTVRTHTFEYEWNDCWFQIVVSICCCLVCCVCVRILGVFVFIWPCITAHICQMAKVLKHSCEHACVCVYVRMHFHYVSIRLCTCATFSSFSFDCRCFLFHSKILWQKVETSNMNLCKQICYQMSFFSNSPYTSFGASLKWFSIRIFSIKFSFVMFLKWEHTKSWYFMCRRGCNTTEEHEWKRKTSSNTKNTIKLMFPLRWCLETMEIIENSDAVHTHTHTLSQTYLLNV